MRHSVPVADGPTHWGPDVGTRRRALRVVIISIKSIRMNALGFAKYAVPKAASALICEKSLM